MAFGQSRHIDSFYYLKSVDITRTYCRCLACFVAKGLHPERYQQALNQPDVVYHLGRAYLSPEAGSDVMRPRIGIRSEQGIVLERIAHGGARTLAKYRSSGGYRALQKVLKMPQESVVTEVERSRLRGRGGAGFNTGAKWRSVFDQPSSEKFIVVNADEGDPGAYIDRFILEDDPFLVIEAATIAGYALKARRGVVYIRKEYPEAQAIMRAAINEARDAGLIGEKICGFDTDFDLRVEGGHGSYLCGEETALLNAIEGRRPEVRARPPYPAAKGLFKAPTLVNNVETLANIPWIVLNGGHAFSAVGFSKSRGTKCVSLNSLFNQPGLYEVDFGVTINELVNDIGGGLKVGELKGLIIGGPLAGVIPPHLLGTRLGFDELASIGASVGHGGVVAFNHDTSIGELMHHVFEFGAFESCGKCTPCRVGSRQIEQHFCPTGSKGDQSSAEKIDRIFFALLNTSLCAHGSGLADFALSIKRHYGEEYKKCFLSQ